MAEPPPIPAIPLGYAAPPVGGTAHIAELTAAKRNSKKLRRAVNVAKFDGWSTLSMGAIGVVLSLTSPVAFGLCIAMVIIGWNQLGQAKKLRQLDLAAPKSLARNQLLLCLAISIYAGWEMYATLTQPSEIDQELAKNPELANMVGSVAGLESTIGVTVYAGVIVGSIIVMGYTAWYYISRTPLLEEYLSKTPEWIVAAERRGELD